MSIRDGRISRRFGTRALGPVMLLFLTLPEAESLPVLSIGPATSQVQLGADISLPVTVTDIADLYAYQFDVNYSPGVLNAQAVQEGPFLGPGGTTIFLPGQIDNNTGAIRGVAGTRVGQIPGVNGDGLLAAISFRAIGAGSSPLTLSRITLLDSQLQGISFQTAGTSLAIVPEPDTLTLAIVGALAVAFRRRASTTRAGS
ncbi:MAG: cohesin domain-containing protein [Bryobacteraceae bacterium]